MNLPKPDMERCAAALYDFLDAKTRTHKELGEDLPQAGVRWADLWLQGTEFVHDDTGILLGLDDFLYVLAGLVRQGSVDMDLGLYWTLSTDFGDAARPKLRRARANIQDPHALSGRPTRMG